MTEKKQKYINGMKEEFASNAWLKTLVHKSDLNDKYSIKILCLLSEKEYENLMIEVFLLVDEK